MLDRNVVLVLRTRQERTERRLRHKKGANPPPMEPPASLLNNNHLYLDLNINFSENCKQETAGKVGASACMQIANFPRVLRGQTLLLSIVYTRRMCIVMRFLTKTLPPYRGYIFSELKQRRNYISRHFLRLTWLERGVYRSEKIYPGDGTSQLDQTCNSPPTTRNVDLFPVT